MAHIESVNLARVRVNPDRGARGRSTGIDKVPTPEIVMVRAPGPGGSGLFGDMIGNPKVHGGADQAVYAYAREDLDDWATELGRVFTSGSFGENLTTAGVDVTQARIGERWRIGTSGLVLEVSAPRTPCRTFAAFLAAEKWIKRFTAAGKPGAYLRVIAPGPVQTGDIITIEDRPDHDVTIELAFRARMSEPELLPMLLAADALSADFKEHASRTSSSNSASER